MEHPIIFSKESVEAILDKRKTQTRRVIIPQLSSGIRNSVFVKSGLEDGHGRELICPYGQVGDFLWVRESLRRYKRLEFLEPKIFNSEDYYSWEEPVKKEYQKFTAQYAAHPSAVPCKEDTKEGWCGTALWQWKNKSLPAIFMPRWASRIILEIINIKVEKLQDISDIDAKAEGAEFRKGEWGELDAFNYIWDLINAKRGYSWESNPWVWAIKFKVIEGEI